jgi:hypothetical protein
MFYDYTANPVRCATIVYGRTGIGTPGPDRTSFGSDGHIPAIIVPQCGHLPSAVIE